MALFEIKDREIASKLRDKELLAKTKLEKKKQVKKSNSTLDVIQQTREYVNKELGQYKNEYIVIRDKQELFDYIEKCNKDGFIAIDTETTGLNPIEDKLVGLCLYSPSQKACYIPVNHVDYITNERLSEQLTEQDIKEALEKLTAKIIMFNAKFDIRVLNHQAGIKLNCYWDCFIAAKLLNENEKNHQLKYLYSHWVTKDENSHNFKELFGNLGFANIPIDCAYLYAANDAYITYALYVFEANLLNENNKKGGLDKVYNLFMTIEMPCLEAIIQLEDNGMKLDFDKMYELQKKYHRISKEKKEFCLTTIQNIYGDKINEFRKNSKCKLDNPINLDSSTQLSQLLYDVIGRETTEKYGKSVGKEALDYIIKTTDDENLRDVMNALLEYRSARKMTSTYIDKMPEIVSKDGRVRTGFQQMGARTGRLSSSSPLNFQNIPSRGEYCELRTMFTGGIDENVYSGNNYTLDKCEEVLMKDNTWKWAEIIKVNDILDGNEKVISVEVEPSIFGKVHIITEAL